MHNCALTRFISVTLVARKTGFCSSFPVSVLPADFLHMENAKIQFIQFTLRVDNSNDVAELIFFFIYGIDRFIYFSFFIFFFQFWVSCWINTELDNSSGFAPRLAFRSKCAMKSWQRNLISVRDMKIAWISQSLWMISSHSFLPFFHDIKWINLEFLSSCANNFPSFSHKYLAVYFWRFGFGKLYAAGHEEENFQKSCLGGKLEI